jgi:hypothetical protein
LPACLANSSYFSTPNIGNRNSQKSGTVPVRVIKIVSSSFRVADPHHFNEDPDPSFHLMRIQIQILTLKRTRILLHIEIMRICGHWSTNNPGLHFEPKRLHLWASTSLLGSMFSL